MLSYGLPRTLYYPLSDLITYHRFIFAALLDVPEDILSQFSFSLNKNSLIKAVHKTQFVVGKFRLGRLGRFNAACVVIIFK